MKLEGLQEFHMFCECIRHNTWEDTNSWVETSSVQSRAIFRRSNGQNVLVVALIGKAIKMKYQDKNQNGNI